MRRRLRYAIALPRMRTIEYIALLAGVCLHVLTIYLGFRLLGFLGAGLSLFFPVAAQVYWVVELWNRTETFWNPFTIICLAYLLLLIVICVGRLSKIVSNQRQR